jgi:hypothetical protein
LHLQNQAFIARFQRTRARGVEVLECRLAQVADSARGFVGQLWTAETGLSYAAFGDIADKLKRLYRDQPIRRLL